MPTEYSIKATFLRPKCSCQISILRIHPAEPSNSRITVLRRLLRINSDGIADDLLPLFTPLVIYTPAYTIVAGIKI